MRRMGFSIVLSVGAVMVAVAVATAIGSVRLVKVEDRCDPATFPPEAECEDIDNGDVVPFEEFLAALSKGGHLAWRFKSKKPEVKVGDTVQAVNVGGEDHTFTEVAAFGGGVVDELNLGLTPAPECLNSTIFDSTYLEQGDSLDVSGLTQGVHLFQCCIHPWMRAEVRVK